MCILHLSNKIIIMSNLEIFGIIAVILIILMIVNDYIRFKLYNDVLCMNRNWWKKKWPEDAQQTFAFAVSAGDTFAYACADAEELLYSELQDLWEHFVLHETFGPMVWVCKKRKMKPLAIWCKQINATGIWNIDEMGLEDNPSEQ